MGDRAGSNPVIRTKRHPAPSSCTDHGRKNLKTRSVGKKRTFDLRRDIADTAAENGFDHPIFAQSILMPPPSEERKDGQRCRFFCRVCAERRNRIVPLSSYPKRSSRGYDGSRRNLIKTARRDRFTVPSRSMPPAGNFRFL